MKRTLNTIINRSKREKNDGCRRLVSVDADFDCGADLISYDAKSRLVSVSEWQYTDFENPYPTNWVEVVVLSNRYDHLDRRIQKITHEATHTYFYDGWLLVKEVVAHTNGANDIVEYHWGNDLSGSRDGAAGIGGLLYLTISNSSTRQLYIPWYDNNGNVMGYWVERGKVAASFSYGAFGETDAHGDNPSAFSIRFSTKYHDIETGLYYYTKRFYDPSLHRWLTRDPAEEEGGVNLYSICANSLLASYDRLGLVKVSYVTTKPTTLWERFRTGYSHKDVEVKSVYDIAVLPMRSYTLNGQFRSRDGSTIIIGDCNIVVNLDILINIECKDQIKRNVVYTYAPHKGRRGGKVSSSDKSRPPYKAILAHERGHAHAFLTYTKPLFNQQVSSLHITGKIDDATRIKIAKLYDASLRGTENLSAEAANEFQRNWFKSNGYSERLDEGKWVYEQN